MSSEAHGRRRLEAMTARLWTLARVPSVSTASQCRSQFRPMAPLLAKDLVRVPNDGQPWAAACAVSTNRCSLSTHSGSVHPNAPDKYLLPLSRPNEECLGYVS